MKNGGSFQEGRSRLPAFVFPDLRNRLKTQAVQRGIPFQEYLEKVLKEAADRVDREVEET